MREGQITTPEKAKMLTFQPSNAKLKELEKRTGKKVYTTSLLSGYSCPYAHDCMSKAVRKDGKTKIKDGPFTKFRCFSASQEAQYPNVYNDRADNFKSLRGKSIDDMVKSIQPPKNAGIVRIHVAGDMFSQNYMEAWLIVAQNNPHITFYAYTKSLPYWLESVSYTHLTLPTIYSV